MKARKRLGIILNIALAVCASICFGSTAYGEDGDIWPQIGEEPYGKAAILMEGDTGAILYGKNIDEKLYPASITKIMTGLLAIENLNLSDTITFTREMLDSIPWDAAKQGVVAGETMTVEDCLYSLLLRSNNDIAVALAYAVSGGEEEFAKMMTERAREIGAINTNFVNSSGLHDENHYTTARDMALITKAAISNPTFALIWSTPEYNMAATNISTSYTIWHRHNMLVSGRGDYYQYANGGKTGYTDEAGRTLVTSATNGGMELIAVILYSVNEEVFDDTKELLNYGFNNFKKITIRGNEERFGQTTSGFSLVNSIYGDDMSLLTIGDGSAVIPREANLREMKYTVNMDVEEDGRGQLAQITYIYGEYSLGSTTVYLSDIYNDSIVNSTSLEKFQETEDRANIQEIFSINILYVIGGIIGIIILAILVKVWIKGSRKRRIGKRYYKRGL